MFVEKIGEQDFTAEVEGLESALGVDLNDDDISDNVVEQRRQQRVAEFSGVGVAILTQQGTGFGSA